MNISHGSILGGEGVSLTPSEEQLLKTVDVPTLSHEQHKGSCGRIAVIGGSEDYAGAPYLAAMAAIRTGADLSYVFTTLSAAPAIKSYSPDLVVRPLLETNRSEELLAGLGRCHAAVVGPGLGNLPEAQGLARLAILRLIELRVPVVVDADALKVFEAHPRLLLEIMNSQPPSDHHEPNGSSDRARQPRSLPLVTLPPPIVVLTPNAMELKRLQVSVFSSLAARGEKRASGLEDSSLEVTCLDVADATGCFVVAKGQPDVIAAPNGTMTPSRIISNKLSGSLRRCAGQGDVLAGIIGTFLGWTHLTTPSTSQHKLSLSPRKGGAGLVGHSKVQSALFAATTIMRLTQRATFHESGGPGRGYIASDLLQRLPVVLTKFLLPE